MSATAPLPPRPRDPYGEKPKLNPCRGPKVPIPEGQVDASSEVWRFFEELRAEPHYKIVHGKIETLICYRDVRIGGIDREAGHAFLYENFGTFVVDPWLRTLGFERQLSTRAGRATSARDGTAYAEHRWYQIDLSRLAVFSHALLEIGAWIDEQRQAT